MAGISHFYERGTDMDVLMQAVGQFQRQMAGKPAWAVVEAWDAYLGANPKRRPTPGDIRRHIDRVMKPLLDEVRARNVRALPAPEPAPEDPEKKAAASAAALAFCRRARGM